MFNLNNLVRWAPTELSNTNTLLLNPLPITPPLLLPQYWAYQAGTDTIANVETSGYFVYPANFTNFPGNFLQKGDLIYCVCSDGFVNLTVNSLNPITTVVTPVGTIPAGSILTAMIANSAVTTAKIADANVTLAKLAAGVAPEAVIKFSGYHTTTGGAAAEAIAIAGALAADGPFVQLVSAGTNGVSVVKAVMTNNTLTVTFSADPGADAIISYQVVRAAS